jgi:hypothetical protein
MAKWTDPHGKTLFFRNIGEKVSQEDWDKIFGKKGDKAPPRAYSRDEDDQPWRPNKRRTVRPRRADFARAAIEG